MDKAKEIKLKSYLAGIAESAGYFPELCELKVEEWYGEITKIIDDGKTDSNHRNAHNLYDVKRANCGKNRGELENGHRSVQNGGSRAVQRQPVHREPEGGELDNGKRS